MKQILRWLARALALLLAAGLALRITSVRDGAQPMAAIFYATPWPILAGLAGGLAIYAFRRRRRCRALLLAVTFAACSAMWVRYSYIDSHPAAGDTALRLVYWNASRPVQRLAQRVAYLQSLKADVIAVGESNVYTNDFPAEWRDGFPGCTLTQRRGGMLLITPEPPVSVATGRLADRGDYMVARCMVKGRALTVLVVDFESFPQQARGPAFVRLEELIAAHRDEPLVVLGDFNTPRESVHFQPIRREFRDAFESAGHGFAETWPVPAPVLSLDRIWLGARWRAVRCELGWSLQSDHRAVIADLASP